jgi:nucleoside-diphosphate-sugar epimerase
MTTHPNDTRHTPRSVLVTGAGGNIGSFFCKEYAETYNLKLMIRPGNEVPEDLAACGEVVVADLNDLHALTSICEDVDTVVHLAANPSPRAEWSDLLETNIVGTYHVMEAARWAGCRRVVYASSIHAVSGYPIGFQVHEDEPVNPGDLYGVSKCFSEALGRYMATQQDLSVIAIRIGSFQPVSSARDPDRVAMMNTFVSQRDLGQLIQRCIDDTGIRYAVFHGLSNNRFNRMDITDAREKVGYDPQDDFTQENPALEDLDLRENVRPHSDREKKK